MSQLTNETRKESHELCLLDLKGTKLKVMRALANNYLTRSDLNKVTGLRISTLCSTLKRLEKEGWVRVPFDGFDPDTERWVAVYSTTNDAAERIELAAGIVLEHWETAIV